MKLSDEELQRLMYKERRAMEFAPNGCAYNDTKKHYLRLKKEYDRRRSKRSIEKNG